MGDNGVPLAYRFVEAFAALRSEDLELTNVIVLSLCVVSESAARSKQKSSAANGVICLERNAEERRDIEREVDRAAMRAGYRRSVVFFV